MMQFSKKTEILSRWLLALVFLAAGLPKLFDISAFAETIAAYGMLPQGLDYPAALVIAALEVIGAIGLLMRKNGALALLLVLLLVFISVLSYGIWLGLDIDCGCFSTSDPEYKAFSGLRHALLRDLLLLIPCIFLIWHNSAKKFFIQGVHRGNF